MHSCGPAKLISSLFQSAVFTAVRSGCENKTCTLLVRLCLSSLPCVFLAKASRHTARYERHAHTLAAILSVAFELFIIYCAQYKATHQTYTTFGLSDPECPLVASHTTVQQLQALLTMLLHTSRHRHIRSPQLSQPVHSPVNKCVLHNSSTHCRSAESLWIEYACLLPPQRAAAP